MIIDLKHNEIKRYENGSKLSVVPLSTSFSEFEILPNGKILVIEDYYKFNYRKKSNLYCLNRNVEIDWFLPFQDDGPEEFDYYVGFTSQGEKIFANTWGCYRVEIDIKNHYCPTKT